VGKIPLDFFSKLGTHGLGGNGDYLAFVKRGWGLLPRTSNYHGGRTIQKGGLPFFCWGQDLFLRPGEWELISGFTASGFGFKTMVLFLWWAANQGREDKFSFLFRVIFLDWANLDWAGERPLGVSKTKEGGQGGFWGAWGDNKGIS